MNQPTSSENSRNMIRRIAACIAKGVGYFGHIL
jgi:hypothetical protein